METLAHFVPAEEHDGNESGFHKKCQDSFDSQWGSEDIAHKPGIVTPVSSELEFQNQTGGDTYGEIDSKQFHPEFSCVLPEFLTCCYIKGLHEPHYHS